MWFWIDLTLWNWAYCANSSPACIFDGNTMFNYATIKIVEMIYYASTSKNAIIT